MENCLPCQRLTLKFCKEVPETQQYLWDCESYNSRRLRNLKNLENSNTAFQQHIRKAIELFETQQTPLLKNKSRTELRSQDTSLTLNLTTIYTSLWKQSQVKVLVGTVGILWGGLWGRAHSKLPVWPTSSNKWKVPLDSPLSSPNSFLFSCLL